MMILLKNAWLNAGRFALVFLVGYKAGSYRA